MFMDELNLADARTALDSRFAKESRRAGPNWSSSKHSLSAQFIEPKKDRGRLRLRKELTFPAPLSTIHKEGVTQQ